MRIAQLSNCHVATPPAGYGSVSRLISNLTERLVKKGHEVTLFATGNSITSAELCYTFEQPSSSFYNIDDDWVHVIKALKTKRHFDVFHNHNMYGGVALDFLADSDAYITSSYTSPNINFLKHFSTHNYVVMSQYHYQTMNMFHPRAIIRPGVDPNDYPYTTKKEDFLLFLGQICPRKGVYEAIQIAQQLNIKLCIAGPIAPWNKEYFDQEIRPLLSETIQFYGEVTGEQRLELLRKARCIILPANSPEIVCLVLIEAMACGTPAIGSDCGSIQEIILNGETGFVANSNTSLIEAVLQSFSISSHRCREYVQEYFTVERMTNDYLKLYEALLEAGR